MLARVFLRRAGLPFVLGGLAWAAIPLVDDLAPALQATFFLAPVALLAGVAGLARAGVLFRLTTLGLGFGFGLAALVGIAVTAQLLGYGSLAAAPLAAGLVLFPLGLTALVAAFAGEVALAYDLWGGPTPRPLALRARVGRVRLVAVTGRRRALFESSDVATASTTETASVSPPPPPRRVRPAGRRAGRRGRGAP